MIYHIILILIHNICVIYKLIIYSPYVVIMCVYVYLHIYVYVCDDAAISLLEKEGSRMKKLIEWG